LNFKQKNCARFRIVKIILCSGNNKYMVTFIMAHNFYWAYTIIMGWVWPCYRYPLPSTYCSTSKQTSSGWINRSSWCTSIGLIEWRLCIFMSAMSYEEVISLVLPNSLAANGSISRVGDYLSDEYDAILLSTGRCTGNKW